MRNVAALAIFNTI